MQNTTKQIKFLKGYCFFSSLLFLGLFIWFFNKVQFQTKELTLERLNIVESNGQLSLIISNGERIDIGDHRKYAPRRFDQGMLFFNDAGRETGGFVFSSEETDSTYTSFQHLSFDQYNGDQNLVLAQYQEEGYHFKGLILQDYPDDRITEDYERVFDSVYNSEGENDKAWKKARAFAFNMLAKQNRLEKRRLVIGSENTIPKIQLNDKQGNPRIKIYVDSTDSPVMEFLGEKQEIITRIPSY
ncbi:MAG: hypothetical protein AAGA43_04565 [Bacteroidota bacterium]